jgi:Ca2+:H+ antiporter
MSRVSSLIVLGIYVIYIMYELRSRRPNISHHAVDMESQPPSRIPSHSRSRSMDRPEPLTEMRGQQQPQAAVLGPRTIRFADDSESEVSAITSFKVLPSGEPDLGTIPSPYGDDPSEDHRRRPRTRSRSGGSVYQQAFGGGSTGRSRSGSYTSGRSRDPSLGPDGRRALVRSGLPTMRSIRTSFDEVNFNLDELEPEEPSSLTRSNKAVGMAVAIVVLVVSSILMSMNAEFLVSTIDEMTHEGGLLSEAIIGLIILPIVGNMAEYITVVTVAVRRNLDLAVAVSVGSSIQIALCVTPLTVLASWILDREMILTFNYFEMSTLVGAVLLVNLIILGEGNAAADSTANALKGGLMCGCYAMISYV